MGAEVARNEWSNEQRRRYREKIVQNLDVFERMLVTSSFDSDVPMTGMEIELSAMIGRKADLRTAGDLSRYFRDEVLGEAEVQYAS